MNFDRHVKYAKSIGAGYYAEDVVQEAYIKCLNNNNLNEGYIILAIRSVAFDLHRANKRVQKVELQDNMIIEDEEYIEKPEINFTKIEPMLKDVHWFHVKIFKLYCTEIKSIRKLAKKTKIGERTIFNSIKLCKEKLKENQKDWEIQLQVSQVQ